MKKLIAIALLSIHLFNLGGYHLLYQYFIYQSDKVMNEHIARNMYNIHDLVEVKVPVHLSISSDWTEFETITGQIQFREDCYNYVKLKLTRDTIYVMCVPNYEKTRLINANIICAKSIADLPAGKHDNLPSLKKSGTDIYNYENSVFYLSRPVSDIKTYIADVSNKPTTVRGDTPYLPPDRLA